MRILVISNLYPPDYLGGYELLCAQVCRALAGRRHGITVLTSTHGLEGPGADEPGPPAVRRELQLYLPFDQPARLLRGARRRTGRVNYDITRRAIVELQPDVIFVWSQLRLTLGPARAAEESGRPVAYTFNDEHVAGFLPAPFDVSPRALICFCADRWLMPEITLRGMRLRSVTCISEQLKRNLVAQGVPIAGARVIYQGIPLAEFPLKESPGALHDPPRILYVGQLHSYKGVHTLIEAVRLVTAGTVGKGGPSDHCLDVAIVGEGPSAYTEGLRAQASEVSARIRFVGRIPHAELPAVYREHDIFVFPSTWQEPFGLTHLEAMASGTPVLSTAEGGHGEFLEDGVNALVFPREDARRLAELIFRLVQDGQLRRRLALTARDLVARRFTVDRYVTDLEGFLAEARQEAKR